MSEEMQTFLFRHKQIRRYSTAGFEFSDFMLRIEGEAKRQEFLDAVSTLPDREKIQIVEVNERAAAAAETPIAPVGSTAVHGAMTAADILTAKDKERLAQQNGAGQAANPAAPVPNQAQPSGFAGLNAFKVDKK